MHLHTSVSFTFLQFEYLCDRPSVGPHFTSTSFTSDSDLDTHACIYCTYSYMQQYMMSFVTIGVPSILKYTFAIMWTVCTIGSTLLSI